MYERVHIGSPSGWGSRNAPSYGLSTYGGAWLATDTGSVGIGTTSPSYKLHVNGSFYASGHIRSSDFFSGTDGSGLYFEGNSTLGLRIQYPKTISNGSRSNYDSLLLSGGTLKFNSNIVWHAGNDGHGSGLDADLLDGKHASEFSLTSHEHTYITSAYKYTG